MAIDARTNFAWSTVDVAPSPATTGTTLTPTDDADFPTPPFNAMVRPINEDPTSANAEIVRVTANAAGEFTIVREQEGTTARTIVTGDYITAGPTKKTIDDIETDIGAKATKALDNLASVAINTSLLSDTDNTDALGSSSKTWSDLYLGDGSVIDWNSDVTLTHSANTLTFAGGTVALGTATATGGLTGNVTGNVSGSAATVTGASQAAITTLANLSAIQGWTVTLTGNFIRVGAHSLTLTTTATTDVTLPTTGTLATLAGTETLSGKTLTAPKLASGGFIADANGNELLIGTTTAEAVNEVTLTNAATTTNPILAATGGDTNIDLDLRGKGTGSILQTIRYQTDDSDVIANSTQTSVRFCIGWGQLTGDGDAGMSGTVGFDPDFTTILWAAAGPMARSSSATAAATSITDLTTGFGAGSAPAVSISSLGTTGFTVAYTRDSSSTFTSGSEYGFWWMAAGIGTA